MVTLDLRKMAESVVNTKNDETENAELNNPFNIKRDTKKGDCFGNRRMMYQETESLKPHG